MIRQQGFLSIAAIIILTVFALLAAILIKMSITSSLSVIHIFATHKSNFLAQSALEESLRKLRLVPLIERQSCSTLAVAGSIGEDSYLANRATDSAHLINPKLALSHLRTLTTNSLTVQDSSNFAPSGRLIMNREAIDYALNNRALNRFEGITRAVDGSQLSKPVRGSSVSQYQCTVQAIARSPQNASNAISSQQIDVQMPMVWAVGQQSLLWNAPTAELSWRRAPASTSFNGLSMLNYASGWAVGDAMSIAYWDASNLNWQVQTLPALGTNNLQAVSTVSSIEAWAVGQGDTQSYTILRFLGGDSRNWCPLKTLASCGNKAIKGPLSTGDKTLTAIDMLDTTGDGLANVGMAVGRADTTAILLIYNGKLWSEEANLPSGLRQLNDVKIMSQPALLPRQAWAVGQTSGIARGKILQWLNGSWRVIASPTSPMLAIDMHDTNADGLADTGWVVGEKGQAYRYVSGTFTAYKIGNDDLTDVKSINSVDAWAIDSKGRRWHWDGTRWTIAHRGHPNNQVLKGLAIISPKQTPQSTWRLNSL